SSYGQEMARSKEMLEKVLKERNDQQIKYVLSVAKLKAQGKDLTVVKLKKLLNDVPLKEGVILKKMQSINLYLNSLMPDEAKRFINKFQRN
ncbi:MAG: hypothetical protein ACTSWK_16015, partial [Promethearchaeota archaeon]